MEKVKIGNLEVSDLILGGGKLVDMDLVDGDNLIEQAIELGINCFDGHHRYGNAESIFGSFSNVLSMSKISAYAYEEREELFLQTAKYYRGLPDIYWVSDLDNEELYEIGKRMYAKLYSLSLKNIGITTESPAFAFKFMNEFPECELFMIPVNPSYQHFDEFIEEAKVRDKKIFGIKPFDDGRCFKDYSIDVLLHYAKKRCDCVVVGTKSIEHLKENVKIWGTV